MRERKRKTQSTKDETSVIQKYKTYVQENIKKLKKEFGDHTENEELLDRADGSIGSRNCDFLSCESISSL